MRSITLICPSIEYAKLTDVGFLACGWIAIDLFGADNESLRFIVEGKTRGHRVEGYFTKMEPWLGGDCTKHKGVGGRKHGCVWERIAIEVGTCLDVLCDIVSHKIGHSYFSRSTLTRRLNAE